jgi:hypothetical protein
MSIKQTWIERAKETYAFHRSKRLLNNKWSIILTAKALRRSIGSISEDLLIARWTKTHSVQLEKFNYAYEALEFIREKQQEQEFDEL